MSAVPSHLFTAIDHVGVAVADLDAAIAFYRDTYGMSLAHEEVNEEQGVREAMMAVGDSGSCIQLLAPLSPESTIAKFLDRSGPGIQQMAYRVEDVDAVSEVLRERGLRLLYPEAEARHVELADQLHPPQGRRRHPRRAGGAGEGRPPTRATGQRPPPRSDGPGVSARVARPRARRASGRRAQRSRRAAPARRAGRWP